MFVKQKSFPADSAIATGSIDHVCAIAGAIAAQNAPPAPAEEVPAIGTEIVPDI